MRFSELIKKSPNDKSKRLEEQPFHPLPQSPHQPIPPTTAQPSSASTHTETKQDRTKTIEAPEPIKSNEPESTTEQKTLFEKKPVGIYELAKQMGIDIPDDKDIIVERARRRLRDVFNAVLDNIEHKELIWPTVSAIIIDLDKAISADTNIVTDFHRYFAHEERLLWHCLYTAIIAMELAKRNTEPLPLHDIGCAALIHDIGWLAIRKNYDILGDVDDPEYRKHVDKGVEILSDLSVPQDIIDIVAQHHEQMDGQGFPRGIRGEALTTAGQILALASIFEHRVVDLTFPRKKDDDESSPEDLSSLVHTYRKAYKSELLKQMIEVIGFYPVGSIVELNNHSICMVIKQNKGLPLRPVLEVIVDTTGSHPEEKKIIDMKEVKILSIIRMLARSKENDAGRKR